MKKLLEKIGRLSLPANSHGMRDIAHGDQSISVNRDGAAAQVGTIVGAAIGIGRGRAEKCDRKNEGGKGHNVFHRFSKFPASLVERGDFNLVDLLNQLIIY
jgi:hypothetical protein